MLTESTHSATGDTAGTDPIFALDTDVATCAVVPENDGEMWWAAKVESEYFVSKVDFISSHEYLGKLYVSVGTCRLFSMECGWTVRYV